MRSAVEALRQQVRRRWRAVRDAATRLPLRWRLALVSFGLLAVLLTALGTLVSISEQNAMLSNEAESLSQEAQQVLGHANIGGETATDIVHQLTGPNVRAVVLGTNGTTTVDQGEPYAPPVVTPSSAMVASALNAPQSNDPNSVAYFYSVITASNGQRQLVVLIPLYPQSPGPGPAPQSQQPVALLVLSTPTAPIDRAVAATRLILGIGIAVALGLAAALTIPLMDAALRPLVAMERASRRIANGELSLRLDVPPSQDEIGRLARAFNSMVAQLEAAFARQKRFVADVSHELRTPLTALGGGLEMLLLGADRGDPAATRRLLRSQYAEVERMRRLVEDLLTLARLDEGHVVLRSDVLDAGPLLRDLCESAEQLMRGQELHSDIASDLPYIQVDGDRLRQVLLVLLDNAVKYTPVPGTITLRAHQAERHDLTIEVQDTGVGISAEALPHVFERFYRADPARERTSNRVSGSGLGLAIAKSLVEAQGGRISIASTPGEGTTVSIWFPGTREAQVASPARADDARSATQAQGDQQEIAAGHENAAERRAPSR
jgi:two-component system, OmpR family, sensor kinase